MFAFVARHAGTLLKDRLEGRSKSDNRKADFLISTLSGIHTVKAMGMEQQLLRRFEEYQADITCASYRVSRASGFATTLSISFGQLSQIITAIVGCLFVLGGELSMGGLSACTLLAGRALQPVQRVMGTWLRLQDFAVARTYASALFALPANPREKRPLPMPVGMLALQQASFGYSTDAPLFKNVSLMVEPGQIIAITGNKGTGKSTLLQLMAGVLTPGTGSVQVDDINVCQHSMTDLRAHVGYLPQQGVIFKGTILQNLTGFQPGEETAAIAKHIGRQLGLDTMVDQLPKGYATMLEDSPADPVPPGVKQRIALARVLKNLPTLLLFRRCRSHAR